MSNPLNPNLYHGSDSSTRYRCADGTTYSADAIGTLHSVLDKHVAELTANGFSNRHPRDLANPNNGNQAGKWGNG